MADTPTLPEVLALDAEGREPYLVSELLGEAVRARPGDAELQSRWLGFLVTRPHGQALISALDEMTKHVKAGERHRIFAEVAAALLYRAEVELALSLTEQLPDAEEFAPIKRFADALHQAATGWGFVPGPFLTSRFADEGPFLLPRTDQGQELREWLAGQLEALTEDMASLSCALIPVPRHETPNRGLSEIDRATWERHSADVSWQELVARHQEGEPVFVEIGIYGAGNEHLLLRVHDSAPWDTPQPPLPPDRYFQHLDELLPR
jgi:hypothetical protein